LTERFIKNDPPTREELSDLRRFIRLALERPVRELNGGKWKIATGTSGTILALGGVLNFENPLEEKSSSTTQNIVIPFRRLVGFNEMVSKLKFEERLRLPGMSAQRAEIIIAGGQILEGVMQALSMKELCPCELALREGVVIDYLSELEAEEMPPVPDVSDSRLRGVFAVGRRFSYEETHALQVAGLAEKIFDALMPIFNLKRHDRTLLSAAAILHDIGYHIAHAEHHKHSLYLIKHSELTGFSEPARNVIANVARYHRGSLPREKHAEFMALSLDDKQRVWHLGAILRLADALDRSYESNVTDVRCQRAGKNIVLKIFSEKDCENELETALQKADMFEAAFNHKLKIISQRFAVKA
jgi:exopolyphosphatase/guanosine-5'-triphosphate,3'-diphosphate pyrophosphatase